MALKYPATPHYYELRNWYTHINKDDLLCATGQVYGHKVYRDGEVHTIINITLTQSGDHYNIGHGHGDNRIYILAYEDTKNKSIK